MARLNTGRKGGPRRTTVARTPYWRPDINQWTFIPSGPTHKQAVEISDPETGEMLHTMDQYQSKGWMPLYQVPDGDPRRDLLPRNYQDLMRDHKAVAVIPDTDKSRKAAEELGIKDPDAKGEASEDVSDKKPAKAG